MTPVTKNHNVLAKAVPTAKPARSFALALPAIIVSAVPINIYDIWDPKIGMPILINCLNSKMYLLFNLMLKYFFWVLYHNKSIG